MCKNYVMCHCHSDYSLLDSCTKFQEYVDLAVKNGQKAIASTEHGKFLGWISKKLYCDKVGVKFMHGVEIYLTETLDEKVRDNYHTVLIAKNQDGIRELNRLVTKSCDIQHFYYTNRISFDEFLGISDNIISTSACLASPLNKLPTDHPRYMELARKYTFLEIQPHNHPEQIAFNQTLFALSKEIGTPLIAGTDTHSSSKYKAECRAVLLSAKRKPYSDEGSLDLTYKTYDELVDAFARQGALRDDVYLEAIENTNRLADMVEDFTLDRTTKYPLLYGSAEADDAKFTEVVEEQFAKKLSDGIIPQSQKAAFRAAIDEEMRVFRKIGMTGFMLSMHELLTWCKSQGMAIGTARGSVGGSRVAYVTDIIDLNPETWHTVFSRFANEDRVELGDIDVDVIEEDRPKIFQYIINRFGADKTARVASFGTIQSKGVIDDVGRHLAEEWKKKHTGSTEDNPWSLQAVAGIKKEFDENPEETKKKYPALFYYYDGLIDTKVSQSVHPAGMIISPITLDDNYGMFDKDGENCLMLDMAEAHDVSLVKYDFLVLSNVQIIRDTCRYLNKPYPRTHEIDWDDAVVWESMREDTTGIFQFSGQYATECLRKFAPKNIFEMSLVTACIRPSGASYRDDLLARKVHKNPSPIIDELLKENLGQIVYQEDTIKFLQQICGLSGSAADTVRRAIGHKSRDEVDKAMPAILEGYCNKSSQPREIAEQEAKEFLQIIEDSASYQFGKNHSIAYCLLGYMCAYYRYYHPIEFITSFLNNAANDDDIRSGTAYARKIGIKIIQPKWGYSKSEYFFNREKNIIAKGLSSIKYIGSDVANELYDLSKNHSYSKFMELLLDIGSQTSLDLRQLDILIKLDFFSDFGNQRELLRLTTLFTDVFKKGNAKKLSRSVIDGTPLEPIVREYATGTTKAGTESKFYTVQDMQSIILATEDAIKALHLDDLDILTKVRNFNDALGYAGYVSGKEEDRRKLYIQNVRELRRRKDKHLFGYNLFTKSIGSGKESQFTTLCSVYNKEPVKKGDIIYCDNFTRDGKYFKLLGYHKLY